MPDSPILAAFCVERLVLSVSIELSDHWTLRTQHFTLPLQTVAVAQLVESRIVIPVVVGSSPISHPNNINNLAQFHRLGFVASGHHVATV